jgi:hypothetical protein
MIVTCLFAIAGGQLLPFAVIAALFTVAFLFAALSLWILTELGAPRRSAVVRVSTRSLHVEHPTGAMSIPLHALTRARLTRAADALELTADSGVILRVPLDTLDEADRLIEAIAAGGSGRCWKARLYVGAPRWLSMSTTAALGLVIAAVAAASTGPMAGVAIALLGGVSLGALEVLGGFPCLRRHVVIGADGLAIRSGKRERFIPCSSIAQVEPTDMGVRLALWGGEQIELSVAPPWRRGDASSCLAAALAAQRRARLLALLRDAAQRGRPLQVRGDALLERRGRTATAWQTEVRRLVSQGSGGYRSASLTAERALGMVANGQAPVELRIGAAMALSPDGDAQAARRLRVAIKSSASRALQEVLLQAAEGELDEAALERALALDTPRRLRSG